MNRLVLIGNGFDLAHGLKTSYADFINWYWAQWGYLLRGKAKRFEEDELCSFSLNEIGLGGWYLVWGHYYHKTNPFNWDLNEVAKLAREDRKLCEFKYKSPFFEQINKQIDTRGWVDIENEYYAILTKMLHERTVENIVLNATELNNHLAFLCKKLTEYLKKENEKETCVIEDIKRKIYCPILENEVSVASRDTTYREINVSSPIGKFSFKHKLKNWKPSQIMLLNFNYTNTPQKYVDGFSNATINYIHGCLNDSGSVIFGYGDELDREFPRLKELNDNECLRHVKSIKYLESDKYRKMLEFIESEPFQVCIMGHSCGNSDRTLLNTIFEHPNCISIKPYYYINEKQEDNYLELVQNIYRNFTDLKLMRDRVVNKEYTEPLTNSMK